jgi:lysozyme family protein
MTSHQRELIKFMINTLEGGYKTYTDPNDIGGKTRAGIASKYYPNLDLEAMTEDEIDEFYFKEWYSKVERISWEPLKDFIFCTGINTGMRPIIRLLQITLNQLDIGGEKISEDGLYGNMTDNKVKTVCLSLRATTPALWSTIFWDRYFMNVYNYYSQRGTANHHFLGWYNRINRTMAWILAHSNCSDDFLVTKGIKK